MKKLIRGCFSKTILKYLIRKKSITPHELEVVSKHFDENYYIKNYPDVLNGLYSPLEHFLIFGHDERRKPCEGFDTAYYADHNPDVVSANINLFYHYLVTGKNEQRAANPREIVTKLIKRRDQVYLTIEREFDHEYYLARYPDIEVANVDPVEHYIEIGASEHRDPSPKFSTKYYIEYNEDVAKAGINPFYHYIVAGQFERRFPKPPGGYKAEVIWQQAPIEEVVKQWKQDKPENVLDSASFVSLVNKHLKFKNAFLSISHDNYIDNVGGVQVCIRQEQLVSFNKELDYIHISPYQPSPTLVEKNDLLHLSVIVNGKKIGTILTKDFVKFISQKTLQFTQTAIHALQGLSTDFISEILDKIGKDTKLWMHDSFLLCANFTAQRNNVDYCHLPNINSQACEVCVFGDVRKNHSQMIQKLISSSNLSIICPSEFTKRLLIEKNPFDIDLNSVEISVVNHLKLSAHSKLVRKNRNKDKVKIAYLGYPALHKGWNDFENIYLEFSKRLDLSFVHIGGFQSHLAGLEFVHFSANNDTCNNMKEIIKDNKIDIVIIPARIPETFNLVCYEAIAAGAEIYCFEDSGNIAKAVAQFKQGKVFRTFEQLQNEVSQLNGPKKLDDTTEYTIGFSDFSFDKEH